MLPKVATHILHHTSRAVAAVQNQTHAIRNVLQLQSSSGQSATSGGFGWNGTGSSSGWGSTGAGPGGAKFNAGSRFYSGYTGAGRAVTQANSSTSRDDILGQSDDTDDTPSQNASIRVHQSRMRSHSLSMGAQGRSERGEKLEVLKTVQIHARSRHAFSERAESSASKDAPYSVPHTSLVRRNSTDFSPAPELSDPSLPSSSPSTYSIPSPLDPASPQTVAPPLATSPGDPFTAQILEARASGDINNVLPAVDAFRKSSTQHTLASYNAALEALRVTRPPRFPLHVMLSLYDELIQRSLLPDATTYTNMILALIDRDHEIQKTLMIHTLRSRRHMQANRKISAELDAATIASLEKENNLRPAISLFESFANLRSAKIDLSTYLRLLSSCAIHGNVDAAIHVFSHLEQRLDIKPPAVAYGYLISVYANASDLQGAKEIFEEFKAASKTDRISWNGADNDLLHETGVSTEQELARVSQVIVWNKMLGAYFCCEESATALALLEQMMDSESGAVFNPNTPPLPASSTFTEIISGFCQSGDVESALTWFDRLLKQTTASNGTYEPLREPSRPNQAAWDIMLPNLVMNGKLNDLNRLFGIFIEIAPRDGLRMRPSDISLIMRASLESLKTRGVDQQKAGEIIDHFAEHLLQTEVTPYLATELVENVFKQYARRHGFDKACTLLERYTQAETEIIAEETSTVAKHPRYLILRNVMKSLIAYFVIYNPQTLTLHQSLKIAQISARLGLLPTRAVTPSYLHSYGLAKQAGTPLNLSKEDWELLIHSACISESPIPLTSEPRTRSISNYAFAGTLSLLQDFRDHGLSVESLDKELIPLILFSIEKIVGSDKLLKTLVDLGPQFAALAKPPRSPSPSGNVSKKTRGRGGPRIDQDHSRFVDEWFLGRPSLTPLIGYARFKAGVEKNIYPIPTVLGRLINALGRLGEVDKVKELHSVAQVVLESMQDNAWKSRSWLAVEDQTIIAYAHSGDINAALHHRDQILSRGQLPGADAYGALIHMVKDTTDDVSNAMALFLEAQAYGVVPNIYLYNTIISKLSKARKADHALEFFRLLKDQGILPTSITYGAVIAACARVGDALSAESLFVEMTSQNNFKPRIPPYNTMMQFYTHTKPDREKVLSYYRAILEAKIQPTAHTFKLLLDAYGTIEPVDTSAMQDVFRSMESKRNIRIGGAHWASLINAWGCAKKDLEKAIEIFDSISAHPSSTQSDMPLPDAVTFEALFNAIVTNRRTDLFPQYLQSLHDSGVHMTAYIANHLIKGYATCGELQKARDVFESLLDPPEGVAAPNNHEPHNDEPLVPVSASTPVYREPSTWEAMVRGELGNGHRDRALALLDRLQQRKYPIAVFNRISGIMLDGSASPWPAPTDPTTNIANSS